MSHKIRRGGIEEHQIPFQVDKMRIAIEDNPFAVKPERRHHAETPMQVGEVERRPLRFPTVGSQGSLPRLF